MPIGVKGFQKGNTTGKLGGRPAGAKNRLPIIRDRVFKILSARLLSSAEVAKISTESLLKFAAGCLPKDLSLAINKPTEIQYISNVPRPAIDMQNNDLQQKALDAVVVSDSQNSELVDTNGDVDIEQGNQIGIIGSTSTNQDDV